MMKIVVKAKLEDRREKARPSIDVENLKKGMNVGTSETDSRGWFYVK